MRISTSLAAALGGGLLTATVLAVTITAPPDESTTPVRVLQSSSGAALPDVESTSAPDASSAAGAPTDPSVVPASSSATSPSTTQPAPAPLTDDQKALIDEYLAAHPGRAQHLADVAARWKAFADANPELAEELAKVAAMPPADRKAELQSWFADHPEQKEKLGEWLKQTRDERVQRRQDRRERRDDRRDRRHERWQNRHDAEPTPAPSPTTSGSAFTPSA
jgi:hypothetical protein